MLIIILSCLVRFCILRFFVIKSGFDDVRLFSVLFGVVLRKFVRVLRGLPFLLAYLTLFVLLSS